MEFEFEFEEQENYSHEEVQAILDCVKGQVNSLVSKKDYSIGELTTQLEGLEELQASNHQLQVKNLAIIAGLDEDVFELIYDEDLKKVESKIEKLKSIAKATGIDGAYKPQDKKKDDDISKLEKDGNVQGMLKHKLSRLLG